MAEPEPGKIDWTQVPLHPFLFAAHPILFLYARNAGQMVGAEVWRPLWFSLASTAVAYAGLRLVLRDFARAALVLTVAILLFFRWDFLRDSWHKAWTLEILVLGALVTLSVMVLRRPTRLLQGTRFLNLTAVILVGMSLVQIGVFEVADYRGSSLVAHHLAEVGPPPALAPTRGYAPDIYYIILDGYGRKDVLDDIYGKRQNRLVPRLAEKGFYVAPLARSNYGQTLLSLASSLNMEYLTYLAEDKGMLQQDRRPLLDLVRGNNVCRVLRSLGYTTVLYPSVYITTRYWDADVVHSAPTDDAGIGVFDGSVAEMTPLPGIAQRLKLRRSPLSLSLDEPDRHRMRTTYALDHLGDLPEHDKPIFVFTHILCPHPPFLFNRNGATRMRGTLLADGTSGGAEADRDFYRIGYKQQVEFVNTKVIEFVDRILAHSKRPPIIILQGDHGPGSRLVFGRESGSTTTVDLRERMSILNAYYLPAGGEQALYPTITPVNTFRTVFNYYFGAKYPSLPDQSFFSAWMTPYRFIEYAPGERAPKTAVR